MTAFTDQQDKHGRTLQWLVEFDIDRCSLTYTQGACTVSDAGDGLRCGYSFLSCQLPSAFVKTTRTWRFCLPGRGWPDPDTPAFPLLDRIVDIPQQVDPDKLSVFPETLKMRFHYLPTPPPADHDKGSGFYNTTEPGEFWRMFFARNPNYVGRKVRIKRGFVASGFTVSDFVQYGPEYLLTGFSFKRDYVEIKAESPLKRLKDFQLPFPISDDNTLQTNINASATSIVVNDASEYPDPADYSRNTIFVKIGSEEIAISAVDTGTNTLTASERGANGTTAASHTAGANTKVSNVVLLGTYVNGGSPTARHATEVLQDILDFVQIPSADVDDTQFDSVRDRVWPDEDLLYTLEEPTKVSEIARGIREPRGMIMFMDSAGKWGLEVMAPNSNPTMLDNSNFVIDSFNYEDDEEARITRTAIFYDPNTATPSNPEDFNKIIVLVNTDLEGANNFNATKEDEAIKDSYLDPGISISAGRNFARRIVTRRRYGIRTYYFQLELVDADLEVGDQITIDTDWVQDTRGSNDVRPAIITMRKLVEPNIYSYEAVDLALGGRYLRIGEDSIAETYDNATSTDKAEGGYCADADNRNGTMKEQGAVFF